MEDLINSLRRQKQGYGHSIVSIEKDGQTLKTLSANTVAMDVAFDPDYDDADNTGNYYTSRREAQEELVNQVLRANEIEPLIILIPEK